jgi:hypothetical protein
MPKTKTSNRFPDPLVPAKAGTQNRNHRTQSKPLLDSRLSGNERRKAAVVAPDGDNDEPMPQDIDEFRRQIVRKIQTMRGMYRRCRAPICRRVKRCAGPTLRCVDDFPARKTTPEQQAAAMAALQRALKRRLQQVRDEQGRA